MIKKIILSLIIVLFASAVIVAQNFTALYTFDSVKTSSGLVDPTAVPTVTGAIFGSFSATGTPVNPNATGRFSFTDWSTGATTGNDVYSSLTGSISTSEYYEVTITPVSGYTIDLSSITFSVQRSGTGIRTYAVRSSADVYATNLPASINPSNTNLSVQTGDIFFWNFDATTSNQNGSTITLNDPNFTAISAPVSFRFYGWNAEGSGGTFSIDNLTITGNINSPIVANYSAINVCEGNSTSFMDLSTSTNGNIATWAWDFGDSTQIDSMQNPIHLYSLPGMYIVTLTVINDSSNTDTFMDTVHVYPNPVTGFMVSGTVGMCTGNAIQFTDSSTISGGTITDYLWIYGDGTTDTSGLQNPYHTYDTSGNYVVTEIVTSDMGCSDVVTSSITIASYPVANFSFSVTGTTVDFSDLSTDASSWFWDMGDLAATNDTSVLQDPSYTYPADVSVTACLTVTNAAGCADTACQQVFTDGINEAIADEQITIYPNPSTNGVFTINTVHSSSVTTITVYNLIGKAVYTKELNSTGKQTIDLSNQANGAYFMALKNDKKTITRKIVINK